MFTSKDNKYSKKLAVLFTIEKITLKIWIETNICNQKKFYTHSLFILVSDFKVKGIVLPSWAQWPTEALFYHILHYYYQNQQHRPKWENIVVYKLLFQPHKHLHHGKLKKMDDCTLEPIQHFSVKHSVGRVIPHWNLSQQEIPSKLEHSTPW